jgi:membrane fusion protein, macrolide-specific efflux system
MRKVLIGIIILVIAVAGFFIIRKKLTGKSKQEQIVTADVTRGNIEVKVLSTGTVQPYTRVEVNSPVSGRIDRVLVDEGNVVKPGDVLAWISSEDRIALLDAARSNLDAAQKKGDSAAIKDALASQVIADNAYKPVPLTNSISGQVIARSCEPGQNVTTQTVLFVISDRLVASVQVDEADIGKIFLGQDAVINLDAFPNENILGKVTKIAHEGSLVSDVVVYNIMVEPLQVPSDWSSGMTANVSFVIVNQQNVLTIPSTAVKERNGNKFVLVMTNNHPEPKHITTGATDGKSIEITDGLAEGDKVVVSGLQSQSNHSGSNSNRTTPRMRFGGPMMGGPR